MEAEQKLKEIEDELFLRFRDENDESSFNKLFNLTESWLFMMIFKIVGSREVAKDVMQNVWIQIIENRDRFNPEKGKFVNYLFTVGKNNAMLWYKKEAKFKNNNIGGDEMSDNPADQYEITETGEILMNIIKKLNVNFSDVILEFYFADFDIKEIARRHNTNEQNIKNWLRRAKIQIEKRINDSHELRAYFKSIFSVFLTLIIR